jgi:hypothetical protein
MTVPVSGDRDTCSSNSQCYTTFTLFTTLREIKLEFMFLVSPNSQA